MKNKLKQINLKSLKYLSINFLRLRLKSRFINHKIVRNSTYELTLSYVFDYQMFFFNILSKIMPVQFKKLRNSLNLCNQINYSYEKKYLLSDKSGNSYIGSDYKSIIYI